ncbi:MAG: hypothetical protein PVH61_33965 [Candidatus Aminicenantes bacterium]|jgi:hypothetical protein
MKTKPWLGLLIILAAIVLIFPQAKNKISIDQLQKWKTSIHLLGQKHIESMKNLKYKNEIEKALKTLKNEFINSGITRTDKGKEVLTVIDAYINEVSKLKRKAGVGYQEKSAKFSRELNKKFQDLIAVIGNTIKSMSADQPGAAASPLPPPSDLKVKEPTPKQDKKAAQTRGQDITKVTLQITDLLGIVIAVFLLNLLAGILLYVIFYKNERKKIHQQYGRVNMALTDIKNGIADLRRGVIDLKDELSTGFDTLKNQQRDIILLVKQYGEEMVEKFSSSPGNTTAPGTIVKPDIIQSPPLIDFPGELTGGQRWVNLIISAYQKNQEKIINLVEKATHGPLIKKWLENIGKEVKNSTENNRDEKSFFESIYPDIKTNRSKLSDFELNEFKNAFLDPLLKALEIEEFAQPGERFNPTMHQVIGEQRGSGGNVIKRVLEPGYRMKYEQDIIRKALVEF